MVTQIARGIDQHKARTNKQPIRVEVTQDAYSQLVDEILKALPGTSYIETVKIAGVNVYVRNG